MPDQFSKSTILTKFKQKAISKGFNLTPDTSEMSKGVPLLVDLLEIIAETIEEIIVTDQSLPGTIKASSLKIGPTGLQQPVAYKEATIKSDIVTDPKFWAWMEAFHAVLQGAYPEPGYGSPNVFATALKLLLSQKPSSITGKITKGSGSVKVTT
jgi:hypothetical protein